MKCDSDISMESNSTDHHSSDVEGLRGVHLTQLPEGFSPASSTHALLILTLSVLDQTSTNCKDGHKKNKHATQSIHFNAVCHVCLNRVILVFLYITDRH